MHRLKKVGFTQEQSEAQAQIVTEIHETNLATKQDLKNLEKKTDSEIGLLKKDMNNGFALIHKEFALVRKEMDTLKLDLTVRMTLIMGSLLTLFSAIQKLF
jgi:hypothetical protein